MSLPEPQVEKRAVSTAMRRRVIAEQDGICARSYCEAPAVDVDHILPLWLKGKNDRRNLEGLCGPCHASKTKAEAKARARCRRLAGETCTRRGRPIPQRPDGGWPAKGSVKLRGSSTFPKRAQREGRGPNPFTGDGGVMTSPDFHFIAKEDGRIPTGRPVSIPGETEATVAALYVETGGAYFGLEGVEAWDQVRDARTYAGPHPVVAHPPCQRWGKMWFGQPLTVKKTGIRKIKGDDGGCFEAALAAVRQFGGVLEHPWGSHAWPHFGLNGPHRAGGWITADFHGGWTCCVEQGRYGHYARKPTLLYAVGVDLPELLWGHSEARLDPAVVERMGLQRAKRLGEVGARGGGTDSTPRIHTPPAFRDLLIGMARSVNQSSLEKAA